MAGMEALGRLLNAIPVGSGNAFRMRSASGVLVLAWNTTASQSTTLTLTEDSSFGGSFSTGAFAIKNIYYTTANNGTAAWNKLAYNPGTAPWTGASANNVNGPANAVTFNAAATNIVTATCIAVHVFTSELADPNSYIKATMTGATAACAILPYDLVHQRGPANLEILGA